MLISKSLPPIKLEPLEDRRLFAAGPEFRVTPGYSVQSDAAAADNGRAVYVYGADHSVSVDGDTVRSTEAFVRLTDTAGVPTGAAVRATEQHRVFDPVVMEPLPMVLGEVDVAADADGDFVVAWTKGIIDGYTGSVDIGPGWYRRFSASGAPRGPEVKLGEEVRAVDVATKPDGDFVVAYGTFNGIFVRRYDAAGVARGGAVEVEDRNLPTWQSAPSLALADDGRFVVAWQTGFQDGTVSRHQVRA